LHSTEYKTELALVRFSGNAEEAQRRVDGGVQAVVQGVNTPHTTASIAPPQEFINAEVEETETAGD
jgi:hypothetical protein